MIIEQISMFDLLNPVESPFTSECRRGSGFENGKVRIYCASLNMGLKDFSEYLKDEYGIGGCSATFPDGRRGFTDYSPKGFVIREYKSQMEEKYSWLQVAKEIKRLILSGDYLTEKEKAQVMEVCERNGGPAPVPKARMAI
jgi:hypothetical protein